MATKFIQGKLLQVIAHFISYMKHSCKYATIKPLQITKSSRDVTKRVTERSSSTIISEFFPSDFVMNFLFKNLNQIHKREYTKRKKGGTKKKKEVYLWNVFIQFLYEIHKVALYRVPLSIYLSLVYFVCYELPRLLGNQSLPEIFYLQMPEIEPGSLGRQAICMVLPYTIP